MKLLGSGPDMAAELKNGDRAEGGAEGGLPQRSFGGQAIGFGELLCLVSKIFMLSSKPIGVVVSQ